MNLHVVTKSITLILIHNTIHYTTVREEYARVVGIQARRLPPTLPTPDT
jgi:ABC-type Mn2+/Zn2+ transport system permease subunit